VICRYSNDRAKYVIAIPDKHDWPDVLNWAQSRICGEPAAQEKAADEARWLAVKVQQEKRRVKK
jgi:hypothetical protein